MRTRGHVMRRTLFLLSAALMLAGCASRSAPVTVEVPPAEESNSASSSAHPQPEKDFQGLPLSGLPDCEWSKLTMTPGNEGERLMLPHLEAYQVESSWHVMDATGEDPSVRCVIREIPDVTFVNPAGELMNPSFHGVQYDPLPWVLPQGSAVSFYFPQNKDRSEGCAGVVERIARVDLTFADGTVLSYPQAKPGRPFCNETHQQPYQGVMHAEPLQ